MITIDYQTGGIVSKQLIKTATGNITLFAFDGGQGLSEHTSPFDAVVTVIEGDADITIAGKAERVITGQLLLLPAGVPHGVHAPSRFKMTLTMLRS